MNTSLLPRTAALGLAALVTLGVMAGLGSLAGDEQIQVQRMAAQRAQQPALASAQAQDQAMAAQRAGAGMPVSVTIAPAAADCVSGAARI